MVASFMRNFAFLRYGLLQRIHEVDELVRSDRIRGRRGNTHTAAVGSEDTCGLVDAGTDAECLLLGNTERACELLHEIILDIERGILQELHADAAEVGQLEGVDLLLTERGVALGVGGVLGGPLRGGVADRHGDLALMLSLDDLRHRADHILLYEQHQDFTLKILRHEITAVCVRALGEDVVDEHLAAQVAVKILFVGIGGAASFLGFMPPRASEVSDRVCPQACSVRFDGFAALHTLDLVGHGVEIASILV